MFVFREEYYVERRKPTDGKRGVHRSGRPRWSRVPARPSSSSASSATVRPARSAAVRGPIHPLLQPGRREPATTDSASFGPRLPTRSWRQSGHTKHTSHARPYRRRRRSPRRYLLPRPASSRSTSALIAPTCKRCRLGGAGRMRRRGQGRRLRPRRSRGRRRRLPPPAAVPSSSRRSARRGSAARLRPAPPSTCSTGCCPAPRPRATPPVRARCSPASMSSRGGRRLPRRGPGAPAALHVDTGMNRLGMRAAEVAVLAARGAAALRRRRRSS